MGLHDMTSHHATSTNAVATDANTLLASELRSGTSLPYSLPKLSLRPKRLPSLMDRLALHAGVDLYRTNAGVM